MACSPQRRAAGDAEHVGRLADREPSEEPQLHDLTLPRAERTQLLKGLIECQKVQGPLRSLGHFLRERDPCQPASPAVRLPSAGVLHEDATHQPRGHGEEDGAKRVDSARLPISGQVADESTAA